MKERTGKKPGERQAAVIFQRLNQPVAGKLVTPQRKRQIETRRMLQAAAANRAAGAWHCALRAMFRQIRQVGRACAADEIPPALGATQQAILHEPGVP